MKIYSIGFSALLTLAAVPDARGQGDSITPSVAETERSFGETITVVSASRQREPIADAPAAVTAVLEEEIERQSVHEQVPKLLEFTPGVEVTQSGVFNFNLNVRGFNSGNNRRVLVLIDGRDNSIPYLDCQEWANFSVPLFEVESLELVRGPSSALYGSNAVNGVINITTKSPLDHQGGRLRLSGGELDTTRFELSHAGALGGGWHYRLGGAYQSSGHFTRSRVEDVEYAGLQLEPVPLTSDRIETASGSFRVDRDFRLGPSRALLTLEGGTNRSQGPSYVTTVGRFQITDAKRPWARLNLDAGRWNLFAAHTVRDNPGLLHLGSGDEQFLDSHRTQIELRGNQDLAQGRSHVTGGISYVRTNVNTVQILTRDLLQEVTEDRLGVFFQINHHFGDRLKATIAGRWDDSNLYDGEFSPKAALVWSPGTGHRLRLTFNEAFQAPNIGELFTYAPVGVPLDLSHVERRLAPLSGGAKLGLENVVPLALGNEHLLIERVRTVEAGYSGAIGSRLFFTVDVYRSELRDFVSNALFQVGTSLGRLNPDFGPYQPPADLSPAAAAELVAALEQELGPALFPFLSNSFNEDPILALLSFTNVGRVETTGFELALNAMLTQRLRLDVSYSAFEFDVQREVAESPISPNAPEQRLSLLLAYAGARFDATLGYRWSEGFDWYGGVFAGTVPSYDTTDLAANYRLSDRWSVGINIANLLDEEHYQIFGGDLLRRRALAHVSVSW